MLSINSIQKEYVFSRCSNYSRKAEMGSEKKIKPVIPRVIWRFVLNHWWLNLWIFRYVSPTPPYY